MSIKDYEGGIITKNPTTPTGPYQDGVASGVWTMDQAAEYTKQGVWPTAGNISPEQYVDGLFSTYLYTGTGTSPNTITNNLDLAGKGGLIWTKARDSASIDNVLVDTARATGWLVSNSNAAASGSGTAYLSFNSNGYDIDNTFNNWNGASIGDYVSWSFLKKPGFFDIVTYTGTGSNPHTVSHNLGSVPGFIVVKAVSSTGNWCVAAYDGTNYKQLSLNSTDQSFASASVSNIATSTTIDVGYMGVNFDGSANSSGVSYVGYLFAHDDQRFGDNANESIIKCGSYTGNNSADGPTVTLGWEPQWLLIKESSASGNAWSLYDMMRNGTMDQHLRPNASDAEATVATSPEVLPQATGFKLNTSSGRVNRSQTYIYIAIRRPMMTPTAATEVFAQDTRSSDSITTNFPVDAVIGKNNTATSDWFVFDRLRKTTPSSSVYLKTNSTAAELSVAAGIGIDSNTSIYNLNSWSAGIYYNFKRATGFFDVVAYTGDGVAGRTVNHNLGVKPELIISKRRDTADNWWVGQGFTSTQVDHLLLLQSSNGDAISNDTYPAARYYNEPTSTSYTIAADSSINGSGSTYIAYLFATLAGVSKVGSYTGTAANLDVDCGFSAGARFVLIKRTDSTGDWYVYDSVRGIVAGNDPYLLINSTAAEVTSTDYIDPLSSGFTVTSSAPVALNASGGTYIFLAIA